MSRGNLSLFVPNQSIVEMDSASPAGPLSPRNPFDLREIGRTLLRRRWLIAATILFLVGSSFAVVSSLTPRYTAQATLMVGDQQPHVLDLQAAVTGGDTELVESEMQILKSRRLARMVIEKLNLMDDPLHHGQTGKQGWLSVAIQSVKDFASTTIGQIMPPAKPSIDPTDAADTKMSGAVDRLLQHLTVVAKGRSRVINIDFDSENPKTAAAVANTLADLYIKDGLDKKLQSTVAANQWLTARVDELRNQVVNTDRLVQQRRSDAGITEGRQVDLINEQISSLSEQLILAGADRAQADAKVQEAQRAAKSGQAIGEVAASPVIQKLRTDQAELQQKAAQAGQLMGDKNPVMIQLRAQMEANNAALGAESGKIISALANAASIARAREQALSTALANLKAEASKSHAADVDISAQQRDAQANHNLYDRLLSRAKETGIEAGLQQPDAHVISHADVPQRPSYPNKPMVLLLSFISATLVASLLVVGSENIDQGFRDLNQVEQTLGVSALGFVPLLRPGEEPETHILTKPFSGYSEAIRGLYTSLILSDVDHPPKVILVTSSLPGEGKSSISIALARLVARSGRKVVVIDGDLRKPRVHEAFGVPFRPGLVDYLAGSVSINNVLLKDKQSEAYVLPPGTYAPNPTDVFSSDNMQKLLRHLSSMFDLIILDSAPLLAVSDTRNLCRLADKVLFVLRWQHTRSAAATHAIRQILSAGGDMAGILLTMTNMKKLPNYTAAAYYQKSLVKYFPEN